MNMDVPSSLVFLYDDVFALSQNTGENSIVSQAATKPFTPLSKACVIQVCR